MPFLLVSATDRIVEALNTNDRLDEIDSRPALHQASGERCEETLISNPSPQNHRMVRT